MGAVAHRITDGLHLTEVGTAFHEQAKHSIANIQEVRLLIILLNKTPQRLLRIDKPMAFGRLIVIS